MTVDQLIAGLKDKRKIALSRAITIVENRSSGFTELLDFAYRSRKDSYRIGITGPPGAGKSTLVSALAKSLAQGEEMAIVAVDPTSPFSGGALLGDRIRMRELAEIGNVFIRSMASRGSLGGLSLATENVLTILESYGMARIIVETIGVGQVEIDIAEACDTIILVLVPESGDGVQVMKAGLIEIADIILVNKADRDGADLLFRELNNAVQLSQRNWQVPIIKTIATENKGVDEVLAAIDEHHKFLFATSSLEQKRKRRIRITLDNLIEQELRRQINEKITEDNLDSVVDKIYQRLISPFKAVDNLLKRGSDG